MSQWGIASGSWAECNEKRVKEWEGQVRSQEASLLEMAGQSHLCSCMSEYYFTAPAT